MKKLLLTVLALGWSVQALAAPVKDLPLPRPLAMSLPNVQERMVKLAAGPRSPEKALALGIMRSLTGRHAEALPLLEQASKGLPPMAGWAALYTGLSRFKLGEFQAALDALGVVPEDAPFYPEAVLLAAYCLDGLDSPEALARYRRFLALGDHPFRSVALWRAAELSASGGDFAAAGENLSELWLTLPWTSSAEKAGPLARELFRAGRISFDPDSAASLRRRVELLLDKGQAARALPLAEQYARVPGADPGMALYLKGKALYSRRDTTAAVQHFEDAASLSPDPVVQAWAIYHQARCLWRFSGADEARRMEELLTEAARRAGTLADGAELAESSGRLLMLVRLERARFAEALDAAERLAASGKPGSETAEQAAWLTGLLRYAQADFAGADAAMAAFMERHPNSDYAPAARYWTARAREASGDRAGAAQALRQVLERWPNGYYGMLATGRLAALGEKPAPATAGSCPDFAALAAPVEASPALNRADLLEAALLPELAERELSALNAAMPKDQALALRLARTSTGLGNHLSAVRAVSRAMWGCLARGTRDELQALKDIVYPNRYVELIDRNLAGSGVDPDVIRGLIRQESFFEPDAVSGAGAVGLMQLMPATAKSQAEKYGEAGFKAESLKDPAVNVRFGVRYFLERHAQYGGDLALTLASYNAGRVKIDVWREFLGGLDRELFVEFIPYTETRDYVKRILGNRAMYAMLN